MAITKLGKEILENSGKQNKKKSIGESLGVYFKSLLPMAGMGVGQTLLSAPLMVPMVRNSHNNLTAEESKKLVDLMAKGKDITIEDTGTKWINRIRSHARPDLNYVYAPKDSYVLAHELGHATGPLANKYSRIPASIAYRLGNNAMGLRFLESAQKAYNRAKGYAEEDDSKVLSGLSTASKFGTGYQLAEEGQATIRGLNAIKKLQGFGGVGKAVKSLLPAYGTYLLNAGVAHGIAPRLGEMYGKYLARDDK